MANVFEFTDYREYLQHEFKIRSSVNPRFSLRSMARMLALSPASLSGLILRRKNLSSDRAALIARKLKLTGQEKEYFLLQVQLSASRSELAKEEIRSRLTKYQPRKAPRKLSPDRFTPISKWYFMALLEIAARGWISDEDFPVIATALKLTVRQVIAACETLTAMGLFVCLDGRYRRAHAEEVMVRSESPNSVIRDYHRQVTGLAAAAITHQDGTRRFSSSDFFPVSEETALQMREKIDTFLDELHSMANDSVPGDSVYGLSLNFFHVFEHAKKEALPNENPN